MAQAIFGEGRWIRREGIVYETVVAEVDGDWALGDSAFGRTCRYDHTDT
jgi:hypothetical protein